MLLQANWLNTTASVRRGVATDALEAVLESLRGALSDSAQADALCKGGPDGPHQQQLPASVASALSSSRGMQGAGASAALELWQALVACMQLGLSANASLAVSVAMLQCRVQGAQGDRGMGALPGV